MSLKVSSSERASANAGAAQEDPKRRALISEAPLQIGATWARVWCETLRREGRNIDGGWPGTLPEARSRVLRHLEHELSKRGLSPLDHLELAQATSATYERAKYDWLELVRSRKASRRRAAEGKVNET